MSSKSSSTEEMSHIAPAPGSSVIEGSIEENLIPQYPPAPIPSTEEEQEDTELAVFEASLHRLPPVEEGELEELAQPPQVGIQAIMEAAARQAAVEAIQ